MAGYNGYSMSNNAVEAYYDGEKPLSKWTKSDILSAIRNAVANDEITLQCSIDMLKKMPARRMKKRLLHCTSWHHTSKYYNSTDFYSIDFDAVLDLTDEMIERIISEEKEIRKREKELKAKTRTKEVWRCQFLEWSGTRKHPKAKEIIEIGTIKDGWFYREDGTKKSITANGFMKLEKLK